jgi:hypothetical protein
LITSSKGRRRNKKSGWDLLLSRFCRGVWDMPISRYTGRAGELFIDQCQGSRSDPLLSFSHLSSFLFFPR